jgi:hypothetical protein
LDLRGVEVHCDDVVAARGLKHVRHEPGADRGSASVFLILSGWEGGVHGLGDGGSHGHVKD